MVICGEGVNMLLRRTQDGSQDDLRMCVQGWVPMSIIPDTIYDTFLDPLRAHIHTLHHYHLI